LGRARALVEHDEPDLAVLGYGTMVFNALDAQALVGNDYRVSIYDARFAKPIDMNLIRSLVERGIPILTLEDHGVTGGFGAAVIEACHAAHLPTQRIHRLGIPERWIYQDSRSKQLAEVGLDAESIARTMREIVDDRVRSDPESPAVGRATTSGFEFPSPQPDRAAQD
jgi:1-deoxy-D-xylulose-5-phosphate synthase